MEINNEKEPCKDANINGDANNIFVEVNSNNNKCEKDNFSNKFLTKKRIKKKFQKKKSIANISHINIDSFFIFDFKKPEIYFNKLNNKNLIKLNKSEYNFLLTKIEDLKQYSEIENNNNNFIELDINIISDINKYFKVDRKKNEVEKYVEIKLKESKTREKLSCRKLSKSYFEDTGKSISKTYINNILKNSFGLSYLKSTVKNNKIKSNSGIIASFYFIKAIVKCIKAGFNLLFLDESSIISTNNNYRAWRGSNEDIYFNIGTKKRKNLLLVVSFNEVIHFKIIDDNTNEIVFLNFMKEVYEKASKMKDYKFVIIMDNLAVHRTKNLFKYYNEKKINVIFNVVYLSNFNAVELAFRALKFKIYNKLYESIESVSEDIKKILLDKNFGKTLIKNYIETMNVYLNFYNNNKHINIKNINL